MTNAPDRRAVADGRLPRHQQDTGIDLRPRYFTVKRWLQFIALAFAIAAVLAIALLPSYIQVSQTTTSEGTTEEVIGSATVLQIIGVWFLLVLAVPVLFALLPILATGRAWQPLSVASAVLLGVFCVIGSLTIGWYFLPATLVAIAAACIPARSRRSRSTRGGA